MPASTKTQEDSQVRILEAAGETFAEKGFDQATVREIVRRAGMKNIAAVNYYFRDKKSLYDATLRHALSARFEEMEVPVWTADTTPHQKLRDIIRLILVRMVNAGIPWQLQLVMREMTHPTETAHGLVRDFIRPLFELLKSVVRALRPDLSETRLHLCTFSIVGQCFYHRVARPVITLVVGEEEVASYGLDRLADHIAGFSLAALAHLPMEAQS